MKQPPDEIPVSRETRERLTVFADLLLAWNARVNLIARGDVRSIWSRHISDSLQLLSFIDESQASAADVGSGAGFPGLVLAIASGRHFHLIESDTRKAAFLREAARVTQAAVTIHPVRAEAVRDVRVRLITARAVAPLTTLIELAVPLLDTQQSSVCLFLKGRNADAELTDARRRWHMHVQKFASRTDPSGSVLRIDGIRSVECSG